ncbi:MAG: sensor histidine kinase [Alphaproteobacteria bacterium]
MVLTLAIAPPAALSINQSVSDFHREIALLERDLVRSAEVVTDEHENLIIGTREVLSALASQQLLHDGNQPACRDSLAAVVHALPQYGTLALIGADGRARCAYPADREGVDVSNLPWFRTITETREFVASDIVWTPLSADRAIVTAVPLRGKDSEVVGVLAATVSWEWLVSSTPNIDLPEDAFTLLIDSEGNTLPLEGVAEEGFPALLPINLAKAAHASSVAVMRTEDIRGRELLLAVTPPLNQKIRFVLGRSTESVIGPSRLKLAGRLAMPVLILVATILAAWVAGNRMFVRWIVYLQRFARIYAAGRYSVRPQNIEAAPTELRDLANSMSTMMEAISKHDTRLKDELAQRELLIKEIHHRVKNNLQIIASLLNLQARRLTDGAAKTAMFDLRRRIDALALIHRSVYEAEDLVHVDLKQFFNDLGAQLNSVVGEGHRDISLTIEMPSLKVSPEVAIALAMMVIEAVTNAYRHAFVGRARGSITVRLDERPEGGAVLTIADDGIGFDLPAPEDRAGKGLGSTLMEGIARQLGGTLSVTASAGTTIRLDIPSLA